MSIDARLATVANHGASSRVGSTLPADRHAFTKVCWVASSARPRSPRIEWAAAYTSRRYVEYTALTASGSPSRNRALTWASIDTRSGDRPPGRRETECRSLDPRL